MNDILIIPYIKYKIIIIISDINVALAYIHINISYIIFYNEFLQ